MFDAARGASSRSFARLCSGTLATIALVTTPLVATAESASAATATTDFGEQVTDEVTTYVSTTPLTTEQVADDIADDGILTLTGTVVVSNGTADELPAGEVDIAFDDEIITTTTERDAWLGDSYAPDAPASDVTVAQQSVGAMAAGDSVSLQFSADIEVSSGETFAAQVHGIAAQYRSDGAATEGRSVVLLPGERDDEPVDLTTIVPVTAAIGTTALISSSDLEILTAADGDLTLLLDAVEGTEATLAIDPRVLASIRALGVDVPESAASWLARLESLDNPSFALEFADANTSLQAQAGLDEPLQIESFAFATDDHEFDGSLTPPAATATSTPTPGASDSPTPTPTAEDDPTAPPDAEALQQVSATRADLVWPYASTAANPAALADGGTVLVESDQLTHGSGWSTASGTQQRIGDTEALVISSALSDLLATAVEAETDPARDAAIAELTASLSLVAGTDGTQVTVEMPRVATNGTAYAAVVDALDGAGVARVAAPPAASADVASLPAVKTTPGEFSDETVQRFEQLRQQEETGLTLVDLYEDPEDVREELRVNLVNALSNQHFEAGDFPETVTSYTAYATGAYNGVTVEAGSEVQLIGHESSVPVFVSNSTDRTVTVEVRARATTGHLRVGDVTSVTVEPNSVSRAQIPVEAIANGTSGIAVTLWAGDSVQLPSTGKYVVNVNADMETVAIWLVGIVVVLLIGFGSWRMLRRRRREASGSVAEHDPSPTS
ncbi:DUF6049 family protein [Gulosibacter sediminis]|uniref:DUF6049 family protein n=1 Tax=Gulosibacter sediminis TaxID=1729695 RepID=UPI0024AE35D6|nr:DUF6049 family protein [Gulosibacter sediminis]